MMFLWPSLSEKARPSHGNAIDQNPFHTTISTGALRVTSEPPLYQRDLRVSEIALFGGTFQGKTSATCPESRGGLVCCQSWPLRKNDAHEGEPQTCSTAGCDRDLWLAISCCQTADSGVGGNGRAFLK